MKRINVTQSFLPPIDEYNEYLKKIWNNNQLTNQGPFLRDFENQLNDFLGVDNIHLVTNGTLALQLSLRALGITEGEIITTPFTYVATISSILWERCVPVFADIESESLCIDPLKIEPLITKSTKAIMAVHVFGNPCDVEAIELIAKKHKLKVIYDAAHSFAVEYKGRSILDYGDISTCSFHATKPFHTIEGGAIVARGGEINNRLSLIKRFGHYGDNHQTLGINAKMTEFNAAMGLCNLKYINGNIKKCKELTDYYDALLGGSVKRPVIRGGTKYNYSYYPVIIESEKRLLEIVSDLNRQEIYPRRYFYPSLNKLPYIKTSQICSISEDISKRILCLPFYPDLSRVVVDRICEIINK